MHDSLSVKIQAMSDSCGTRMRQLAESLGLADDSPKDGDVVLQVGEEGLQLMQSGSSMGAVRADFVTGTVAHRRKYGGGKGQMIAKAVGIDAGVRPFVLDATAGLGRDAFVLATLGCRVVMVERHPVIAAMLEDALARAAGHEETADIVSRMRLIQGNAIDLMQDWAVPVPAVVYLDPMFPHRDKTALVKKEMRLFRALVSDDPDADALLHAALALATHRVVVKRPRKAPPLRNGSAFYSLEGKSSRYDIYARKSLRTMV